MREGRLGHRDTGCRAVPMFDERRKSVTRGTLTDPWYERIDGFVIHAAQKIRFGVHQATGRKERLEHALHLEVADRTERVGDRCTEAPQRLQYPFAVGNRAAVATGDGKYGDPIGESERAALSHQIIRTGGGEFTPEMQYLLGFGRRVEHRAAEYVAHLVQTVFERGHDAEVAAAAAHPPKKVLVFDCVRGQQLPLGSDHIRTDDIVDRQSVLGMQVTPPAAECQTRDADGRDYPERGGQPERLSLTIKLAERKSGLGACRVSCRIDAYALHRREIDHETRVANGLAGDTVSPAAHGDQYVMIAGETHTRDHVGGTGTARDKRRPSVDHGIRQLSGCIIRLLSGEQDLTAKSLLELLNRRFWNHRSTSVVQVGNAQTRHPCTL